MAHQEMGKNFIILFQTSVVGNYDKPLLMIHSINSANNLSSSNNYHFGLFIINFANFKCTFNHHAAIQISANAMVCLILIYTESIFIFQLLSHAHAKRSMQTRTIASLTLLTLSLI